MKHVIETEKLTKIYGRGSARVVAVNEVSLRIPKGVIVGLLGHNGAGKTTLISMLIGLTLPTSGSGMVLGYDIVKESIEIRKGVGLLPEGFGFYDHLSAYKNLRFFAELNGISGKEAEERINSVLKEVGLEEFKHVKVAAFSRGMKQRLGIAQALLKNPEVLILDEPTVGIDPEGSIGFRNLVRRLVKGGKTVVISTHLLHELGDICNFIVILKRGRLLAQGSVEDLRKKYIEENGYKYIVRVRKGSDALLNFVKDLDGAEVRMLNSSTLRIVAKRDLVEELNQAFRKAGVVLEEFKILAPSLENIFLHYNRMEVSE